MLRVSAVIGVSAGARIVEVIGTAGRLLPMPPPLLPTPSPLPLLPPLLPSRPSTHAVAYRWCRMSCVVGGARSS